MRFALLIGTMEGVIDKAKVLNPVTKAVKCGGFHDSVNALEKLTTLSVSLLTQRPKLVCSEDVFLARSKYSKDRSSCFSVRPGIPAKLQDVQSRGRPFVSHRER